MTTLFGNRTRGKRHLQALEDNDETLTIHKNRATSNSSTANSPPPELQSWATFEDLKLAEPLLSKFKNLGFRRPTPVQRAVIPFLLKNSKSNILALAKTGSGKTAAFVLPILHRLALDPYGVYAVICTVTRELAKQIHQQILALGSCYNVQSSLVIGGLDAVAQSTSLDKRPHFCVATPGRLAELLRSANPPRLNQLRYLVLDEADRLLAANSGFERDVAELLLHCHKKKKQSCQTLLFSATMTRSLESVEELASGGQSRIPLKKFVIRDDQNESRKQHGQTKRARTTDDNGCLKAEIGNTNEKEGDHNVREDEAEEEDTSHSLTPKIPSGLTQEYIFMPSRVRDAYLLTAIRKLMIHGGHANANDSVDINLSRRRRRQKYDGTKRPKNNLDDQHDECDEDTQEKARLCIIFVSTCERAALVSCILEEVGVANVALHSLLSQNRRLAALSKFKSEQVRVLVATDVASRGLDIPIVDLVLNSELPRNTTNYIHRVGRTARAGRRGRAISLVGESDVALVHAAERLSGRPLERCQDVSDEEAIKMLGAVTKAARLAKMKLADIGFDDLVAKFKERKIVDKKERARIERALKRRKDCTG